MRIFKFRAWDKDKKIMIHDFDQNISDHYHHIKPGDSINNWVWQVGNAYGTYMQCTGLKDKNGVDIYEGDVITAGIRGGSVLSTYSIEYDSIYGCWYGNLINSQKLGNKDCMAIGELRFNAEVIGNIYENPELIKQAQSEAP